MPIDIAGLTTLLQVFDMPRAVRFYCDHLGFQVVSHSPASSGSGLDYGWCLLRREGAELLLNTADDLGERPANPDTNRVRAHADTGLFFGCPDVDQAYAQLRSAGLAVESPVVQKYGMKQIYLTDPDGYVLCLQCPVDRAETA